VASRVGGVPEIVEGTLAKKYMLTPGDVGGLVDRIEKLASQPKGAIVDAGVKLREHVLRLFDSGEIESKLLSLFRSIMG
jgi:glycosyltransferase involved in cell wall biosynthesis